MCCLVLVVLLRVLFTYLYVQRSMLCVVFVVYCVPCVVCCLLYIVCCVLFGVYCVRDVVTRHVHCAPYCVFFIFFYLSFDMFVFMCYTGMWHVLCLAGGVVYGVLDVG